MSRGNFLGKIFYALQYFIVGIRFGWGIKVRNNILSMFSIISIFALSLFMKNPEGTVASRLFNAFGESVNRFFSVGDIVYNAASFESLEAIIGIIMLTIITGVIVRKIIR